MHGINHPPSTIRRTAGGTARKAGTTRAVSDAEALRQLGDCVRASARKRLSHHAGRTPGPGSSGAMSSGVKRRASWVRMTLDFENIDPGHGEPEEHSDGGRAGKKVAGAKVAFKSSTQASHSGDEDGGVRIFVKDRVSRPASGHARKSSGGGSLRGLKTPIDDDYDDQSTGGILFGTVMRNDEELTSTTDGAPPSPSPSPRPMSAMSRPASSLSRRGVTPMMTSSASLSTAGLASHSTPSLANANPQRPPSFHRASSSSSGGIQSAPSSNKVTPQEPVSIFKPAPSGSVASRSTSRSVSTPGGQVPSVFRPNPATRMLVDDLDNDATPKAKPQRPIFAPAASSLFNEVRGIDRRIVEKPEIGRAVRIPASQLEPEPTVPVRSEDVPAHRHGVKENSKFSEMEERLRSMMKDIEMVEVGLESAKARLDA